MPIRDLSLYGDDELVLNFSDACLYGRDIRILQSSTAWLNDACIHFALTSLQQQFPIERIRFLDPSVVFCMVHQCDDDDELLDLGRQFRNTHAILLLPVNDSFSAGSSWQTPGLGTHWSLLLIHTTEKTKDHHHRPACCSYYHWDSSAGGNRMAAQYVSRKWHTMWRLLHPSSSNDTSSAKVIECPTPQQNNGHDCGLHVVAAARTLAEHLDDGDHRDLIQRHLGKVLRTNPNYCRDLRRDILLDIASKIKK